MEGPTARLFSLAKKEIKQIQEDLGCDGCGRVQHHVLPTPRTGRNEALVPFVQAGDERGPEDCDIGPVKAPWGISRLRQGRAPRPEQEETQQTVTDNVAGFAHNVVPWLELRVVDAEQEMKNRVQDAAGLMRRKIRARFDGNDHQPQNRGNPGFQSLALMGVQVSERTSKSPPRRTQRDKDGAPWFVLFDSIVRRLARDHDIVHMTLAKAGAADADKTCFLQQFGNSRTATVAHA